MNSLTPIRRCRSVKEWLRSHSATKCPPGFALGISEIEDLTGLTANDGQNWRETIKRQNESATRGRVGRKYHLRRQRIEGLTI